MNPFKIKILIVIITFVYLVQGCKKTSAAIDSEASILASVLNLPGTVFNYAAQALPAFLNNPPVLNADNSPASNPITDNGATLGRVLFYDKNLSINNKISCSSCHQQQNGFSDTEVLSKGFNGGNTGRHSMSLANAKYYPNGRFFWDERAVTLETQVLAPIQDPVEMGMTLAGLTSRLQNLNYYPILFKRAFGDAGITSDRVSKALSQFIRSMISYRSKL